MLVVYRDVVHSTRTFERIARLRHRTEAGDRIGALILAGEIEQGVLDGVDTDRDDWRELHRRLRSLVCNAAAVALGQADSKDLLRTCDHVASHGLPPIITCRAPEGYSHYALDPLAYARAADRFRGEGRHCAFVIGVRSIGTSLGAVVAAALAAPSITVRARGNSGSRYLATEPRLLHHARRLVSRGGDVAIVDEGPGATGETFDTIARWCREALGVVDERIVLFPSHGGNSPLAPGQRQRWLAAAVKFPPPPDDRGSRIAESAGFERVVSISAGQWRDHLPDARSLPARCGFERTKYLAHRDGQRWHIRFAGAGEWGDAIVARASTLANRYGSTGAEALEGGFFAQPWIEGTPLNRRTLRPDDALDAARCLLSRHALFPTGAPVQREEFLRVLELHAEEAAIPAGALDAARRNLAKLAEREAFVCDARIAPHEWIRTPAGLVKVDGVDHGDGFRLPGPADVMWDFAGLIVEFGVPVERIHDVAHGAIRRAGLQVETTSIDFTVARAYAPVYAALAFGDALLSAREAADPRDRRILLREAGFYRRALRYVLSACA